MVDSGKSTLPTPPKIFINFYNRSGKNRKAIPYPEERPWRKAQDLK
jgi:hypothetical protein